MRIGNSGGTGQAQNNATSNWQARLQHFQALTAALQSGDLGGAQQAFASLSSSSSGKSDGPLAQVGQALQNGDLGAAQQALQALQAKRGHHHHHAGSESATPPASATSAPSQSASVGSIVNTTA